MFKLFIPLTKSYKSWKDNVLVVEGIASWPNIDRDEEKFTTKAIEWMINCVNKWAIPIRAEHESKFYSDIGVWKEAKMIDGDRMYVKGEIDLDLSLGRDIEVIMNKGGDMSLSVWGSVLDAGYEYDKEVWKSIKVYKDVILNEISVVKNPSYKDAELSLAKSFDFSKHQQTEEARKIDIVSKSMQKVSPKEFFPLGSGFMFKKSETPKNTVMKTFDEVWKDCCDVCYDVEIEVDYNDGYTLSGKDVQTIAIIAKLLDEVDITLVEKPDELEDRDFVDNLPLECFVPHIGYRMFPHHNQDYTLNQDWLKYQLAYILKWWCSRLTPKEFSIAISHLYFHLIETMSQTNKSTQTNATPEDLKKFLIVAKSCVEFLKDSKSTPRPQVDGNDLSDADIQRFVTAYNAFEAKKAVNVKKNTDAPAEEEDKKEETTEKNEEEEKTEEKEVEKNEEEKEDTEEVGKNTEEESTDNKSEEGDDTPPEDDTTTKSEDKEGEKGESDQTEEEDTVEQVAEKVTQKMYDEKIAPMLTSMQEAIEWLTKSIKDSVESVSKSTSDKDSKMEDLQKTVNTIGEVITKQQTLIEQIGKSSAGRRSVANGSVYQAVEKKFAGETWNDTEVMVAWVKVEKSDNIESLTNKIVDQTHVPMHKAYAEAKKHFEK